MNTRQLRHFLAVMDLGSLSAAADSVHLSLPAISRSLRALEDALRVPLFDRSGRRLAPTPFARAYVDRARRIVFEEKEGGRSLAMLMAGDSGSLSLGMGSSLANSLLAPMMLQLIAQAPDLRVSAMVQSTDILFDALVSERLDFFVGDVRVAGTNPDMTVEPVFPCSFSWFARAGHPLAGRRQVGIRDLAAYPMVLAGYADESVFRNMARIYGLAPPVEEHFALNTDSVGTIRTLMASSDVVTPSTDVSMLTSLSDGSLVVLDVHPPLDVELTLGIVRRTGRTLVPAAERAFEIVRRFFADAQVEIERLGGRPVAGPAKRKQPARAGRKT